MAEPTLAGLLMRPVMPEVYDRAESPIAPYMRAFGAGLVDPMGLPSWAYNKLAGTPDADWYMRRMQEARAESPIAAGMGSAVLPAGAGLTAARVAGALTPLDLARFPWLAAMGAGGALGGMFAGPQHKQRPQAAYPTGGAY